VVEWFDNLPRGVDPGPWAQRFGMWLEGMDRAGGRPCSVEALAKALRDYPLISDKSLSPVFVSRCVDRAERELAAAGKGTEESWTAKPPEAA
jgi:hypothetical protein